jgi:hypothetical protein
MSSRFRHEDVASVPGGWRVRTVKAGSHRVRVAFPPGRRQTGSGRLVSVLHPTSGSNPCANPCSLRATNPAELMVMSANHPPRRRNAKVNPTVPEQHQIKIAKQTLKMSDVGAQIMGGMTKEEAREVLRKHGVRFRENHRVNASTLELKRAARYRAKQIREAGGHNPRRVVFDESIQKYMAHKYLSKYGNMVGTGETKAAAVRSLKEAIARAKGGSHNPSYRVEVSGPGGHMAVHTISASSESEAMEIALRKVTGISDARNRIGWRARINPAELLVMGANPRVEVVAAPNPPTEEIVEAFTGREVEYMDVYNEPHMPRGRYAKLGPLIALYIKPAKGGQVQRVGAAEAVGHDFPKAWAGKPPLVVCDSTAKQIYFVDGTQDISDSLAAFGAIDRGNGIVELGQGRRIDYQCRKEHVADPDEDLWKHEHGEENGELPTVLFDTRNKRILYEGGDYRIEGPWIRN